jgi:hypothetical protein
MRNGEAGLMCRKPHTSTKHGLARQKGAGALPFPRSVRSGWSLRTHRQLSQRSQNPITLLCAAFPKNIPGAHLVRRRKQWIVLAARHWPPVTP